MVVSTKVSDSEAERIRATAEKFGMTRSSFLKFAAELQGNIDPIAAELIRIYSDGLGLKGSEVIEVFLIQAAAQLTAAEALGREDCKNDFLPFLIRPDGKLASGDELFDFIINRTIDANASNPEAAGRAKAKIREHRAEAGGEVMRKHFMGQN